MNTWNYIGDESQSIMDLGTESPASRPRSEGCFSLICKSLRDKWIYLNINIFLHLNLVRCFWTALFCHAIQWSIFQNVSKVSVLMLKQAHLRLFIHKETYQINLIIKSQTKWDISSHFDYKQISACLGDFFANMILSAQGNKNLKDILWASTLNERWQQNWDFRVETKFFYTLNSISPSPGLFFNLIQFLEIFGRIIGWCLPLWSWDSPVLDSPVISIDFLS